MYVIGVRNDNVREREKKMNYEVKKKKKHCANFFQLCGITGNAKLDVNQTKSTHIKCTNRFLVIMSGIIVNFALFVRQQYVVVRV